MNIKSLLVSGLVLTMLVGAVAAGVVLVQREQDIRDKAASGSACAQSPDCYKKDDPGDSGNYSDPQGRQVDYFEITHQSRVRFDDSGTDENGCYSVTISGSSVSWNRLQNSNVCKDISNIQVWLATSTAPEYSYFCHYDVNTNSYTKLTVTNGSDEYNQHNGHINDLKTNESESCPVPSPTATATSTATATATATATSTATATATATATSTSTSSSAPITANCLDVKVFDSNWQRILSSDFDEIEEKDVLYFTVGGNATSGSFSAARFKINGVYTQQVSEMRPGTDEYFVEYTVPSGVSMLEVQGEVYHDILGWI